MTQKNCDNVSQNMSQRISDIQPLNTVTRISLGRYWNKIHKESKNISDICIQRNNYKNDNILFLSHI
jgi:hypothetical protein